MKAKWGAIVTSGSGKLSGNVVTSGKSGSVFSKKRTAKSQASASLSRQNLYFSEICSTWKSLSVAQKFEWNNFPSFSTSAFDNFKNTNLSILVASGSVVLSPVAGVKPFIDNVFNASFCPSQSVFRLDYPLIIEPNTALLVYSSKAVSNSISIRKSAYRLIKVCNDAFIFPLDLYSDYTAVFGNITPTMGHIGLKLVIVDKLSGSVSSPVYLDLQIESALQYVAFTAGTFPEVLRSLNSGSSFAAIWRGGVNATIPSFSALSKGFGTFTLNSPATFYQVNFDVNSVSAITVPDSGTLGVSIPRVYGSSFFFALFNSYRIYRMLAGASSLNRLAVPSSISLGNSRFFLAERRIVAYHNGIGSIVVYDQSLSNYSVIAPNIASLNVSTLCMLGSQSFVACVYSTGKFYRSSIAFNDFSQVFDYGNAILGAQFLYFGAGVCLAILAPSAGVKAFVLSQDNGLSWSVITPISGAYSYFVNVWRDNNVLLVPCSALFFCLRSTDAGLTWSSIPLSSGISTVRGFLYISKSCILAYVVMSTGYARIYASIDFGANWSVFYTFSYNIGCYGLAVINPNIV
jgi:hypothetical protein